MIDGELSKLLSDVSENYLNEQDAQNLIFDNEISPWKQNKSQLSSSKLTDSPARFRIRVAECRGIVTRSVSNSVRSTNESRSTSPGENEAEKLAKIKKKLTSVEEDLLKGGNLGNINLIRIYKPVLPRRIRKPIKVFRLPKVEPSEEE